MRIERFSIDYPKSAAGKKQWNKLYGLNAIYAGKHWSKRREDADYWHLVCKSAMNRAGIPNKVFDRPVALNFLWNDNLDCSNHAYMAKMIEDSMRGRLLKDDSRRYVRQITHAFHDGDYIGVEVCEL